VANDTSHGLADSVLSGDPNRALQVARRLRAGMVHVNAATSQDEALAPFGEVASPAPAAGPAAIPALRSAPSAAGSPSSRARTTHTDLPVHALFRKDSTLSHNAGQPRH
jgi:benzaldehyde dehydrogenase (NAD)